MKEHIYRKFVVSDRRRELIVTAATKKLSDNNYRCGFAFCSEYDNFDRKRGNLIAEGRLNSEHTFYDIEIEKATKTIHVDSPNSALSFPIVDDKPLIQQAIMRLIPVEIERAGIFFKNANKIKIRTWREYHSEKAN